MIAEDIVKQLAATLPKVTGLFSDALDISSMSNTGSTVTVVTNTPHKLKTNQGVVVTGTAQRYSLVALTQLLGVASAETTIDNDLTSGDPARPNITISGANQTEYNDNHVLIGVANRRNFSFQVDPNAVSPATGALFLEDNFRSAFNGLAVVTVVNTTTFTYISNTTGPTPEDNSVNGDSVAIRTNARVARVVDVDRAIASYTSQDSGNAWAFVSLGDQVISRDRSIFTDAAQTLSKMDKVRVREIQPVEIYVFLPSTDEISGAAAKDLASGEIKKAILKAIFRFKAPSQLADPVWSLLTPVENGTFLYNNAYYIHRFLFEQMTDLVLLDGVELDNDRAFRNIDFSTTNDFNEITWSANVDLDEEPLQ